MQLKLILDKLISNGLLESDTVNLIPITNISSNSVEFILDNYAVSAGDLAKALSDLYKLPLINIAQLNPKYIIGIIDTALITQYKVLPFAIVDNTLKIITSDPTNKVMLNEISFKTGKAIQLILSDSVSINNMINTINIENKVDKLEDANANLTHNTKKTDISFVNSDEKDQPVVKFLHKVISDAVNINASDIHFEPYEQTYRIRFRIDGQLVEHTNVATDLKDQISARIKVVAKLDISEKRLPQDGRLRLISSQDNIIDFRVSTLPTAYGEKIVLRILDRNAANLDVNHLGFDDEQKSIILNAINKPHGMILVTGPTGSGKTVTLYSCLNLLNQTNKNISTAEDPIEIPLSGINQVSINDKTGLSFAVVLRALLRQDPDIIMVGEIRDFETAEIAIKSAQTGHLVLSTLHTNDASSALTRLVSQGIPSYNVGEAVLIIVAQRLIRKLCDSCKSLSVLDFDVLSNAGFIEEDLRAASLLIYEAIGCNDCHFTGYSGRIGIFEVLEINDEIRDLILHNASSVEISAKARACGVKSLRQSGLIKVKQGITSVLEVVSNTN